MAATDIPARDPGVPWTVIGYLPVWFAWTVAFNVLDGGGFALWPAVGGTLIELAIWYGLIRGSRTAWIVALVLLVLPLLGLPGAFARELSLGIVSFVGLAATLFLLLHPDTRAWCSWPLLPPRGHHDHRVRPDPRAYDVDRAQAEHLAREQPRDGF